MTVRRLPVLDGRSAGPQEIGVASYIFAQKSSKHVAGKKYENLWFSKIAKNTPRGEHPRNLPIAPGHRELFP